MDLSNSDAAKIPIITQSCTCSYFFIKCFKKRNWRDLGLCRPYPAMQVITLHAGMFAQPCCVCFVSVQNKYIAFQLTSCEYSAVTISFGVMFIVCLENCCFILCRGKDMEARWRKNTAYAIAYIQGFVEIWPKYNWLQYHCFSESDMWFTTSVAWT